MPGARYFLRVLFGSLSNMLGHSLASLGEPFRVLLVLFEGRLKE
jgi:hypothetical protein